MGQISISTKLKSQVANNVVTDMTSLTYQTSNMYFGIHGDFTTTQSILNSLNYISTAQLSSYTQSNLAVKYISSNSIGGFPSNVFLTANGDIQFVFNASPFTPGAAFINRAYASAAVLKYFTIAFTCPNNAWDFGFFGTIGDQNSSADLKIVDTAWSQSKVYTVNDPITVAFPTTFTG